MNPLFENIPKRLTEAWRTEEPSGRGHSYRCNCGRPVFFRNSLCLGCKAVLGYAPDLAQVRALEPGKVAKTWRLAGQKETETSPVWRRCENFDSPAGCNWLVPAAETEPLCVACRLNRTIPDLADEKNRQWWRVIENAKRRLVAQLHVRVAQHFLDAGLAGLRLQHDDGRRARCLHGRCVPRRRPTPVSAATADVGEQ